MKSIRAIALHLKTAEGNMTMPTLPAAKPGLFSGARSMIGGPVGMAAQTMLGRQVDKNFIGAAGEATGGNYDQAGAIMNDPVGGSLAFPDAASKLRSASGEGTAMLSGGSALIPTLAGGLRGGGPYGLFFGAGPLAQQGIQDWRINKSLEAMQDVPEDRRLDTWQTFQNPETSEVLKAENPQLYDKLTSIQSGAQTADKVRGGIFNWGNSGYRLAPKNFFAPTPATLARGAAVGVATLGTNTVNSALGGLGSPAAVDPVTGDNQYEGDVPWWHHSLRGLRSTAAGAVGGIPGGPVGVIGGAIANPLMELKSDFGEIGGRIKDHFSNEKPEDLQMRMIDKTRQAWAAREHAAQFDAAAAKSAEESKKFLQSFSNYRTALGIGVGVPLAGLLLYKMLAKKKAQPPAPQPV